MNEQSYEEYIRSILGYPNMKSNSNNNVHDSNLYMTTYRKNTENSNLEEYYPEIYKIIYPMIVKSCKNNIKPLNKEVIEEMTDQIYEAIESDHNEIEVNITLNNELKTSTQNRNSRYPSNQNQRREVRQQTIQNKKEVENRGENRQFRNRNLRDLIQILLIRELIGNSGGFNGNPPVIPPARPPMRPPFPGGPGSSPRPPIMPRSESCYDDIYE